MLKRPLFLIPTLSLASLAGCSSNSPVPEPYTPPKIPDMYTIPTPTPVPSVTLDTNAFIKQGEQISEKEKNIIVVPTTALDKYIYARTKTRSFRNLIAAGLNEIDLSTTSLTDNFQIKELAEMNKELTAQTAEGRETASAILGSIPQFKAIKARFNSHMDSVDRLTVDLLKYATLKYRITTGTVDKTAALNQMAALRVRIMNTALQLDTIQYRQLKNAERAQALNY